jgi:hypothetical protein
MGRRFYIHMTGSAGSGGWENYHIMGEHMHIENLCFNKFIAMVNFRWLEENTRCLNAR